MRVILVANAKGGVGKTCISVGLAGAWAEVGRRVLIVDTNDPQHTAAHWLGGRDCPNIEVVRAQESDHQLGGLLRQIQDRGEHEVVIVDTPPRAAVAVQASLSVAHTLLVPVTPSVTDISPVSDMLRAFRPPVDTRIVMNCVHQSKSYMSEIWRFLARLPVPVCVETLGRRVAVGRAQMRQKPVTTFEPVGAAAIEIRALAQEVWGNV